MSKLERFSTIERLLREDGRFVLKTIRDQYEVSDRQIKRDIETLRDHFGCHIHYDRTQGCYTCDRPTDDLRFLDERRLLFFVLLRGLAKNKAYLPVESKDLLQSLEKGISPDYLKIADAIRYDVSVTQPLNWPVFATVCKALLQNKALELTYRDAQSQVSQRTIEAQKVLHYTGQWYLIAWDHSRQALRTFHLSRVQKLILSSQVLQRNPHETTTQAELQTFIDSGFGIFKGTNTVLAKLRFSGIAIRLVAQQTWHPDQCDQETESDEQVNLERILPVFDTAELLGRVLSFGSHCEVLEPPEFRQSWIDEIHRMKEIVLS